jgi:putative SOS response-associated peptidase YedK
MSLAALVERVTNSFYEWKETARGKQPYAIGAVDGSLLAVAGLWETWCRSGAEPVRSFTIITTAANNDLVHLHDRMPVILQPSDYEMWLTGSPAAANELLRSLPAGHLRTWPVTPRINRVGEVDGHVPADLWYARTKQDPSKGERWFFSEREAQAAGWRAPKKQPPARCRRT